MIIIKSIIIIKYEMILRARIDFYPNTCYFRDMLLYYSVHEDLGDSNAKSSLSIIDYYCRIK